MSITIGNKVKFLNEDLQGVVKSIAQNGCVVVEAENGFDYEITPNEIVVVHEDNTHLYQVDNQHLKSKIKLHQPSKSIAEGVLGKYTSTTKYQFERIVEIDLHLEELVEFPMKLDDWQRLHTQMNHVKKCLNAALDQKVRKIVFIHGVGTGVLKTELCNYLADFENLTFKDADYREYGSGATEVFIKQ